MQRIVTCFVDVLLGSQGLTICTWYAGGLYGEKFKESLGGRDSGKELARRVVWMCSVKPSSSRNRRSRRTSKMNP